MQGTRYFGRSDEKIKFEGKLVDQDGDRLEGTIYYRGDGSQFTGEFDQDGNRIKGVKGIIRYSDGSEFESNFENVEEIIGMYSPADGSYQFTGSFYHPYDYPYRPKQGKMCYLDGSQFEGEFDENGNKVKGILYNRDNLAIYNGSLNDQASNKKIQYIEGFNYYINEKKGISIKKIKNGKESFYFCSEKIEQDLLKFTAECFRKLDFDKQISVIVDWEKKEGSTRDFFAEVASKFNSSAIILNSKKHHKELNSESDIFVDSHFLYLLNQIEPPIISFNDILFSFQDKKTLVVNNFTNIFVSTWESGCDKKSEHYKKYEKDKKYEEYRAIIENFKILQNKFLTKIYIEIAKRSEQSEFSKRELQEKMKVFKRFNETIVPSILALTQYPSNEKEEVNALQEVFDKLECICAQINLNSTLEDMVSSLEDFKNLIEQIYVRLVSVKTGSSLIKGIFNTISCSFDRKKYNSYQQQRLARRYDTVQARLSEEIEAFEKFCKYINQGLKKYEGPRDEKGQPHGKGKQWEKGVLVYRGSFKNGERQGPGILYNKDEEVISDFNENLPNGITIIYDRSLNKLKFIGNYINGRPNGCCIKYDDEGHLIFRGDWIDTDPLEKQYNKLIKQKITIQEKFEGEKYDSQGLVLRASLNKEEKMRIEFERNSDHKYIPNKNYLDIYHYYHRTKAEEAAKKLNSLEKLFEVRDFKEIVTHKNQDSSITVSDLENKLQELQRLFSANGTSQGKICQVFEEHKAQLNLVKGLEIFEFGKLVNALELTIKDPGQEISYENFELKLAGLVIERDRLHEDLCFNEVNILSIEDSIRKAFYRWFIKIEQWNESLVKIKENFEYLKNFKAKSEAAKQLNDLMTYYHEFLKYCAIEEHKIAEKTATKLPCYIQDGFKKAKELYQESFNCFINKLLEHPRENLKRTKYLSEAFIKLKEVLKDFPENDLCLKHFHLLERIDFIKSVDDLELTVKDSRISYEFLESRLKKLLSIGKDMFHNFDLSDKISELFNERFRKIKNWSQGLSILANGFQYIENFVKQNETDQFKNLSDFLKNYQEFLDEKKGLFVNKSEFRRLRCEYQTRFGESAEKLRDEEYSVEKIPNLLQVVSDSLRIIKDISKQHPSDDPFYAKYTKLLTKVQTKLKSKAKFESPKKKMQHFSLLFPKNVNQRQNDDIEINGVNDDCNDDYKEDLSDNNFSNRSSLCSSLSLASSISRGTRSGSMIVDSNSMIPSNHNYLEGIVNGGSFVVTETSVVVTDVDSEYEQRTDHLSKVSLR